MPLKKLRLPRLKLRPKPKRRPSSHGCFGDGRRSQDRARRRRRSPWDQRRGSAEAVRRGRRQPCQAQEPVRRRSAAAPSVGEGFRQNCNRPFRRPGRSLRCRGVTWVPRRNRPRCPRTFHSGQLRGRAEIDLPGRFQAAARHLHRAGCPRAGSSRAHALLVAARRRCPPSTVSRVPETSPARTRFR